MSENQLKLECPFTWSIDLQLAENFDEKQEPVVDVDEEPLLALINSLMLSYFRAVQVNYKDAVENLKNTDAIWQTFTETKPEIDNASVLLHVKNATKYYVLNLAKQTIETNSLLKNLKAFPKFEGPIQIATIDGCKAVAWSCFHEKGHVKATIFAKRAVANDPNCPLWHFILSKNLRHARRNDNYSFSPTDDERDEIAKCCELSDVPFYKIHLAQMYREARKAEKSKEIYLEIFAMNCKNSGILLRLARAFMAFKEFDKAKQCFDEAEKSLTGSMFWHYKGLFYEKQKDFKMAAVCFEKAAEDGNYPADLQYANTMGKLLRNRFDIVGHLQKMLDKYSIYPPYKQQIYLHIAMHYVLKQSNMKIALTYFLKAIEINPQSALLTKFRNSLIDWNEYNIYDMVSQKLLEFPKNHKLPNDMQNVLQKLDHFCEQHNNLQVIESLDRMTI